MKTIKISNVFSDEELQNFIKITSESKKTTDPFLGREIAWPDTTKYPHEKINSIANEIYGSSLVHTVNTYVEYSSKFGTPTLPPHFDGDSSELIINFQLSSNTSWPIGIDLDIYTLEDNSAVVFHPNEVIHWRPHKTFNDDEYVRMMFFRFSANPAKDYSHMTFSIDDPIFKDINQLRDSSK